MPELPRWDVTNLFPSIDSVELAAAREQLAADIDRLVARFDQLGIRAIESRPPDEGDLDSLEEVLAGLNATMEQMRLLSAYVNALTSTDASDEAAAAAQSELQIRVAPMASLSKRFEAWVAALGAPALIERSAQAAAHAFTLHKAAAAAAHQMSEAEESLAAELRLSGSAAWANLHRDVTSRLTAEVRCPGTAAQRLPMSVVRGLASDADAGVRRAAYIAELEAWESVAVPLAAALNGAKGETIVLNRRRGWRDALEPALFANHVDRATVEAMTDAVVESLPVFRRYLRAKARLLGHPTGAGLPWYDLAAPVPGGVGTIDWTRAVSTVRESFARYSPALARLVDRATQQRWIDAEPREGKVGGAYCMPVRGAESRVLLNYDGSFGSVQTLAHELGHAYHNTNLAERTPLQRQTPMALAETASIFCETLVIAAGLDAADEHERLAILDTDLQGSTLTVVDIHSRFLFELELCARRECRTLGVSELCELMSDAQEAAYGDGLDPDIRHPFMWAVKSHYFTPFYNWPYTFGLLFGIGLYARYREDPDRFRAGYDELLASTGMGWAPDLAAEFGIDVRSRDFWSTSLGVIADRVDEFEELVGAATGN